LQVLRPFQDPFEALTVFFERFLQLTFEHTLWNLTPPFGHPFPAREGAALSMSKWAGG
jgi:hypothetical protein